jgi:hypothetical protein
VTCGARLAEAAQELVGCRFRLRGRDPDTGLDCVGVIGIALLRSGHKGLVPLDYLLHNVNIDRAYGEAQNLGLVPSQRADRPGSIVLLQVGPCQFHFAICVGNGGFVHAHAGLRKVVLSPVLPDGQVIAIWRLPPA